MLAAVAAVNVARVRVDDAWPLSLSALIFLPYIPGWIPPVFMIWEGPIEWIVWAAVLAGLVYARSRSSAVSLRRLVEPPAAPWLAAALAIALSLWAFTSVRAVVPGGDEPHYLAATQSLLRDHDLKVENNYAAGDYLEYFGGRLQPHFLQRSTSGEIYSIHSPGVSFLILPAYAVAGYTGAVLFVIFIAGATAAMTWLTAWRVSGSVAGAWAGVAAVCATAPFLFHTFTIYPDGIGALVVMSGVWLVARLDEAGEPSPILLVIVGAALALLPWLHTRFALLAGVIAVIVIARLAVRPAAVPRLTAFVAVPVVAAAAWFGFFWMIWGTPSPLAPYGKDMESSLAYIGRGVTGLAIDQQFGVLTTAPIYAMALVGLVPLARQRPRLTIELAAIAIPYAIAVSTYAMWWGGTSAPARFIAAILPLAAIAIASAWQITWLRSATVLLLILSASLVVPRIEVDAGRFVFTSRNVLDPTIDWLNRHVDLALALPSVHRDGVGGAWRDALPWIAGLVLMAADAWAAGLLRLGRGATWTVTAVSGAVVVMFAAAIGWTFHDSPGATRDRSALAVMAGARDWHVMNLDARTWASISREELLSRTAIDVPADRGAALWRAARVPAGEYAVESLQPRPGGQLAVVVGRNDPPLESVTAAAMVLPLPVAMASLSVRTDSAAADGEAAMRVRPLRVGRATAISRPAVRAARYGRARVFVFDDRAYLEPKGFWTQAEGRARIVVDADDTARQAGLRMAVTAGAAATTIGVSAAGWSQSFSMTPGERREFVLPPLADATAWVVDIHSGPGFRPSQREPGNADVRRLAAWFEIP